MVTKYFKIAFVVILINMVFYSPTDASYIEGTSTYIDYIYILVHGVNGKSGMWDGSINDPKYHEIYGNIKEYLEKDISSGGMGLKGRVFCYTFSNTVGSNLVDAREFGDNTYNNVALNGESWLEKAREDFQDYSKYPENEGKQIPTKYIVLTHSMGKSKDNVHRISLSGIW